MGYPLPQDLSINRGGNNGIMRKGRYCLEKYKEKKKGLYKQNSVLSLNDVNEKGPITGQQFRPNGTLLRLMYHETYGTQETVIERISKHYVCNDGLSLNPNGVTLKSSVRRTQVVEQ